MSREANTALLELQPGDEGGTAVDTAAVLAVISRELRSEQEPTRLEALRWISFLLVGAALLGLACGRWRWAAGAGLWVLAACQGPEAPGVCACCMRSRSERASLTGAPLLALRPRPRLQRRNEVEVFEQLATLLAALLDALAAPSEKARAWRLSTCALLASPCGLAHAWPLSCAPQA